MDIYEFINSKDIRGHCRKLGHQFNTMECAYLVWQSDWRYTLKEKHAAWQEIISTMPDMELKRHHKKWGSVHQCIKRYMEIEDRLVDAFYSTGPEISFEGGEGALSDFEMHYTSVDELIAAEKTLKQEYNESQDEGAVWTRGMDKIALKRIEKNGFVTRSVFSVVQNTDNGYNQAVFHDETYELIALDTFDSSLLTYLDDADAAFYTEYFEQMWFYVPTPFEKGDIVTTANSRRPHVLEELCFWKNTPEQEKTFRSLEKDGTSEDFQSGLMSFVTERRDINFDYHDNCLSLEYYHGELCERDRVFTAINSFMKEKMDLTLLLSAYRIIINEETQRQEREIVAQRFSGTGLRLAGLEDLAEEKKMGR